MNTNAIPKLYPLESLKSDTKAVSFKEPMAEIARTVRFPERLWDEIDRDAQRCMRSSVKQMEAVLSAYYDIKNVDLNREKLKKPEPPTGRKTIKIPVRDKVK